MSEYNVKSFEKIRRTTKLLSKLCELITIQEYLEKRDHWMYSDDVKRVIESRLTLILSQLGDSE